MYFQGIHVTSIPVSPNPLSVAMMQGPDAQIGCRPPQVLPQESALREAKLVSGLLPGERAGHFEQLLVLGKLAFRNSAILEQSNYILLYTYICHELFR